MAVSVPDDVKYTKDHEWVRQREAVVVVGLPIMPNASSEL